VDCGQRKDKIQWMYLALVGDRKGIRSLKSSSKSPYLSHRGSTAKGPQSLGYLAGQRPLNRVFRVCALCFALIVYYNCADIYDTIFNVQSKN